MVTLFTDDRMLDHVPPKSHPEKPERLAAVLRQLKRLGILGRWPEGMIRPITDEEILRVHTPGYLESLRQAERLGGGQIEADTWMSTGSLGAARLAAGAALAAVELVARGTERKAACLVRPPGHHALADGAMGFCLLASAALAAKHATEVLEVGKVLVVDFDVHHGNGTQAILYDDDRIGFYSVHRHPFYPETGAADETGTGRGLGATLNVPLPFETTRAEYRSAFRRGLEAIAGRIRPELILLSAGFDAHAEDPVGSLGLEVEDFVELTRNVMDVAKVHASGRVVSLLEGGYNVPILAGCVAAHLRTMNDESAEL